MVGILTVGLSLCSLCRDLSDPSSLTEHTSDNQILHTFRPVQPRFLGMKIFR